MKLPSSEDSEQIFPNYRFKFSEMKLIVQDMPKFQRTYGIPAYCVLLMYIHSCDKEPTRDTFARGTTMSTTRYRLKLAMYRLLSLIYYLEIGEVEVFSKLKPHQFTPGGKLT